MTTDPIVKLPPVRIKVSPKFKILYNLPEGTHTVILIGGRGGMKTYEASKWIAFQAAVKKQRCVILRDERSLVRESILNEVLLRYDTANKEGALDVSCQKLETGIKDKRTGEMIVFTKGFRASTNEKRANLKSLSDVKYAIVEEAEDITDVDSFNTFTDSIRKEGSVIILILNTPDIQHFIIKRYFSLKSVEDGYWSLIPKELPGVVCVQSSHSDNPYLPDHIISRYKDYGNPNSHLYNPHYYKTAILGYASSGRKGQVLTKVKPISLIDYLKLPFKEFFGQDFGTASPAGTVGVKFDKNNCYCRQINYLPMNTMGIAKMYCTLGFTEKDKIVADNAEPKNIDRLKSGYKLAEAPEEVYKYPAIVKGFNVVSCVKGKDSIQFGIGLMDSMNLFAVQESVDLWNEIYNYVYEIDKNNEPTNIPVDDFNHLIDPWRYVVMDQRGKGYGENKLAKQMGYFR